MIDTISQFDLMVGVGGFIIAVIGQALVMVRWFNNRFDQAHSRINEVKENYVRRDDHNKEVNRLEKDLEALRSDIRHGFAGVQSRLDLVNNSIMERRLAGDQ
ncbi:hypothetical protein [Kiloniella litopenaei]|uniref:hypothetical protein n=1 Tax=Kiloniella litopenaei TaxID=1549748 RepID=UPI003BAC6147